MTSISAPGSAATARTTASPARPAWRVMARQELTDLWGSARGPTVLFGFTMLLSVLAYLASADAGINLLDARESVGVIVQTAVGLGTLAALVVSADAISGERERGTLEALLVTPLARRDMVLGKLLAVSTIWLAALVIALPYVAVMANGPGVASDAVVVLVVTGALVGSALTGLGLAISAVAMSNRVSLAAAIATMLVLAAPSQLPAVAANGTLGAILVKLNPVSAGLQLAKEVVVNQQPWSSQWDLLVAPLVAAVVFTGVAIGLSGRIELGGAR